MENALPLIPISFFPSTRAKEVSLAERISACLFGSPSACYAHGGSQARTGLTQALREGRSSMQRKIKENRIQTPVFQIDRRGTLYAEKLPVVWLSEAVPSEAPPWLQDRLFVSCYPCGKDEGGVRALQYAESCLEEYAQWVGYGRTDSSFEGAQGAQGPEDLEGHGLNGDDQAQRAAILGEQGGARALQCLQAAEVLLLHSAVRGNPCAYMKLGWMYFEDVCEGAYFKTLMEERADHAKQIDRRTLLKRAAFCFNKALVLIEALEDCSQIRLDWERERAQRAVIRVEEEVGGASGSVQRSREATMPPQSKCA